jgi:hypothetical protein
MNEAPAPRYDRADYKATKKRLTRFCKRCKHAYAEYLLKVENEDAFQPQKLEATVQSKKQ